jgi:RNA polymerase sigma factor (sigma-70 family)
MAGILLLVNPSVTDRELVAAVVAGDAAAAALFVQRFFRFIVAIAGRYARTRTSLGHIVPQIVIESLWEDDFRRLRLWRGEGDFASYLAPIVKRQAVDYMRTPWFRHIVVSGLPGEDEYGTGPFGLPDGGPDAHDALLAGDRRRALLAAMDKLGTRDRDVLERRWIREEPVSAIAAELGLNENAVHQALHRALRNLRAQLREDAPGRFRDAFDLYDGDLP